MKWIYMSNVHNPDSYIKGFDDESRGPKKTFFLFYTEEDHHVTENNHNLVVYTLEKKESCFEFKFFKSLELLRSKNFLWSNN